MTMAKNGWPRPESDGAACFFLKKNSHLTATQNKRSFAHTSTMSEERPAKKPKTMEAAAAGAAAAASDDQQPDTSGIASPSGFATPDLFVEVRILF